MKQIILQIGRVREEIETSRGWKLKDMKYHEKGLLNG